MNEIPDDEFQDLLRRLIAVEPRDDDAWIQFYKMFEPAIRFHSRISGGRQPLLQALMETQDVINSVWRRILDGNRVEKNLLGRSIPEVRSYLACAAHLCLLQKKRELLAIRRERTRDLSLNTDIDTTEILEGLPDETASEADFIRWCYARLRKVCNSDREFNDAKRLLERETTFAQLAREEMARRGSQPLNEGKSTESSKRDLSSMAKDLGRWFEKLCERLGDAIRKEIGDP